MLRLLGRPAHRQQEWQGRQGRQGRQTWSWRYQTNECLWLCVTLTADAGCKTVAPT